jgi:hypothetical protein
VPPAGVTDNPFTIYRDWASIPERWNTAPSPLAERVAEAGRLSLARAEQKAKSHLVR